jgi:hypothetical protein
VAFWYKTGMEMLNRLAFDPQDTENSGSIASSGLDDESLSRAEIADRFLFYLRQNCPYRFQFFRRPLILQSRSHLALPETHIF